jgi:hypothetical protein
MYLQARRHRRRGDANGYLSTPYRVACDAQQPHDTPGPTLKTCARMAFTVLVMACGGCHTLASSLAIAMRERTHLKLSLVERAVASARGSQTCTFSSSTEYAHGTHTCPDGERGVVHASLPSFHDRTLNPMSRSAWLSDVHDANGQWPSRL